MTEPSSNAVTLPSYTTDTPTSDADADALARLIFQAGDGMFEFMFGAGERGYRNLARLIQLDGNSFARRYIQPLYADGQIQGMANYFLPAEIDKKAENDDYAQAFSLPAQLLLGAKSLLLWPVGGLDQIDGMYIQTLAVDPSTRGQGYGSRLLAHVFADARARHIVSVWLDVDIHNPNAKRLYERVGFEVQETRRFPFVNLGVYRMRKPIDSD